MKTTVFSDNVADSSGDYLWSNPANWDNGVPVNGDVVVCGVSNETKGVTSEDDLSGLSLSSLTINHLSSVGVSGNLTVTTVTFPDFATLQIQPASGSAVVNVGTIGGYGAVNITGASATIHVGTQISLAGANNFVGFYPHDGATVIYDGTLPTTFFFGTDFGGLGTLALVNPGPTVEGYLDFGPDTAIEVPGNSVSDVTFGRTLSITTNLGTVTFAHLTLEFTPGGYVASFDAATGLEKIEIVPCYARGTGILTDQGEVAVEALRPGHRIVTLLGRGPALKPVAWIGRRKIAPCDLPYPDRAWPIRIRAGALADGVPHRDLIVSPDHALLLDGVLVHADTLVNGATIVQEHWPEVEYFHIDLDTHDVIVAEGARAESYLDTGNRRLFQNARVVALRPGLHEPRAGEERSLPCAPYVREGAAWVQAVSGLRARAEALGWTLTEDADVHVLMDGVPVRSPPSALGVWHFPVPAGCRELRLMSRRSRPAAVREGADDRRWLGVGVCGLAYGDHRIPMRSPELAAGWHDVEGSPDRPWRWTDGEAHVPPPRALGLRRDGTLTVTVAHGLPYWVAPRVDTASATAAG